MRRKITVVGAGNVGATTAQRLAERDYADVVIVDIVEGMPQGKALDLNQSGPVVGYEPVPRRHERLRGDGRLRHRRDHLGFPRQPGMSRDDLLAKNKEIVGGVAAEVAQRSPEAIVIVVTNPLDAMCHAAYDILGFPRARDGHGRHPGLGALSHLPGVGARCVGARRDGLRARRPRRHDGAGGVVHQRGRRAGDTDDRLGAARGDRPAHARRWRGG